MARFSRGSTPISSRSRAPRRKTSWIFGPGDETITAVSTSSSVILGAGLSVGADGLTLVRTRGELMLWLTAATALNNGFLGAFGIGVVTDPAFVAGIGSLPTPITEMDWDGWLYHRFINVISAETILGGAVTDEAGQVHPVTAGQRIEVDSKAMRKIGVEEIVFAAIEVAEIGTAVMSVAFNSRLLVKLP